MRQPLSMNTFTRIYLAIYCAMASLLGLMALIVLLILGYNYSETSKLNFDSFTNGFSSLKFEGFIVTVISTIIISLSLPIITRILLFLLHRKPIAIIEDNGIRFCETTLVPEGFLHWNNIESYKRISHGFIKGGIRLQVKNYNKIWKKLPIADLFLTKIIWAFSLGLWKGETNIHTAVFGNFKEFSNDEIEQLLQEVTSNPLLEKPYEARWIGGNRYNNRQTMLGSFLVSVFTLIIGFGSNHLSHYWDEEKALTRIIRHFAIQGDPDAQTKLGWRYSNGVGAMYSHREAVYWFKKAATQGYAKSQYNLGAAYSHGRGVERDYDKAFHWLSLAAEQEQPNAKSALAYLYRSGKGVKQSYPKAIKLYEESISAGITYANTGLGYMYEKGYGVEPSTKTAIIFYKKAAENNDRGAIRALKRLSTKSPAIADEDLI